jgi:hypothetical protein
MNWRLALGLSLLLACAVFERGPEVVAFRMAPANSGAERYSAWFADSDGRVLYFGLSPFWDVSWQSGDDPKADLKEPGDHLIGRFDLDREVFLQPLRVREVGPGSRSSVWDVLAHSNGRIYFTTYFEEIGSVRSDGSDLRLFEGLGVGFNELSEARGGNVFVTRYSSTPLEPDESSYGAVVELTPDGELVREIVIARAGDDFAAPKSVAVDPESGDIWLNTDTFRADESIYHETVHLAADGRVLGRHAGDPELQFVRFDRAGRGWFAESDAGTLRVRVTLAGHGLAQRELGPRPRYDFVQDIHFASNGTAAIARWSGIVHLLRLRAGELERRDLDLRLPPRCGATGGPALLYSAILHERHLYGTIYCGATVLRKASGQ